MIINLVRRQHLRLPLVAGKDDDLAAVGFPQPFECSLEAAVVVEHEAVIEDQGHLILAGLDQLGGCEAERQIDLIHGSAADLVNRNQLGSRIHKDIQVLIHAHTAVDAAGDTVDQLRGRLIQI